MRLLVSVLEEMHGVGENDALCSMNTYLVRYVKLMRCDFAIFAKKRDCYRWSHQACSICKFDIVIIHCMKNGLSAINPIKEWILTNIIYNLDIMRINEHPWKGVG